MKIFDTRIKKIDAELSKLEAKQKKHLQYENMTEDQLDKYFIDSIVNELKSIKNILDYESIDLSAKGSYIASMKLYRNKYTNDLGKKDFDLVFTDERLEYLNQIYEDNKQVILSKI